MGLFVELEGDCAIVVENGVYKQVPLYSWDGYLYAKAKGGFIRLYADGSTTSPKCRLDHLSFDGDLYTDKLGKLSVQKRGNLLSGPKKDRLLLGPPE